MEPPFAPPPQLQRTRDIEIKQQKTIRCLNLSIGVAIRFITRRGFDGDSRVWVA